VPFNVGPLELIIVLVIVLVIFGPKRLPGLGRSLGSGMREFKDSLSGKRDEGEKDQLTAEPESESESERIERSTDPTAAKESRPEAVEEKVFGERRG
jgi:sec-independent protein translocase protein TatA